MISSLRQAFSGPFFVPLVQPIELFFFQRVFHRLCVNRGARQGETVDPNDLDKDQEVPLVEFQRAMVRLFRVIKDDRKFDIMEYDVNKNGKVGWYEFCSLWKERQIAVHLTTAERVFLTLEDAERSVLGKIMSILVFLAILVSVANFIIGTIPDPRVQISCRMAHEEGFDETCRPRPKEFLEDIDTVCAMFFTLEYGVRLVLSAWMRTELVDRDKTELLEWMVSDEIITLPSRLKRVRDFALNWSNLVDFAALLPWYLSRIQGNSKDDNIIIKIIRLTRVIRAFRLGRRFEAVVIIMRSLKKSMRALYVLVLNLFLGMVIFGAGMYFAEQGEWDPELQQHVRPYGEHFDNSTYTWVVDYEPSPFESIPACFWWAIVTATTVGYGDKSTPKTLEGKLVAGISMVWSLCVLALPIGVIGGNFSQVWTEYDSEKREEEEHRRREEIMLKKSMAFGDPLHYSRRLLLEVWHDSGLPSGHSDLFQSEFMGEIDTRIELEPDFGVEKKRVEAPLVMNREKARRKVKGNLTFEYTWQPMTKADPDALLVGRLEVTIIKADNLLNIDWKGSSSSDPYVVVTAFPHSPAHPDDEIPESPQRTSTELNTTCPKWDHTMSWDFLWTQSSADVGLDADMRKVSSPVPVPNGAPPGGPKPGPGPAGVSPGGPEISANSPPPPSTKAVSRGNSEIRPESQLDLLRRTVPELQDEIGKLKGIVPHLQAEIRDVRRDVQLILSTLKRRDDQVGGQGDTPGNVTAPTGSETHNLS